MWHVVLNCASHIDVQGGWEVNIVSFYNCTLARVARLGLPSTPLRMGTGWALASNQKYTWIFEIYNRCVSGRCWWGVLGSSTWIPWPASWVGKFIKHGHQVLYWYILYVICPIILAPESILFWNQLGWGNIEKHDFLNLVTKCPTDLGSESRRRLLWVQDISWSWEWFSHSVVRSAIWRTKFWSHPKHPFHGTYRMASSRCHGADFPGDLNVLRLRSLHFPSTLLGRSSWHQPGDSLCWCSIMNKSPENWLSFERPFFAVIVPEMRKMENRNYMNE